MTALLMDGPELLRSALYHHFGRDPPRMSAPVQAHYGIYRTPISAKLIGRIASPETIAKRIAKTTGQIHTAQQRANISASLRGKPKSEATKAKISATLTGRKNAPHSLATRAKMSVAVSERKMSLEATAKRLATRAQNALYQPA